MLSSPELNSHEFLFEQLPKIFECNDYDSVIKSLRYSYQCINDTYKNVHLKLIAELKNLFGVSKDDSLSSVLANFYDDLKVTTKEHLFSGKASMFLDIAKHPNNDEYKLIEMIGKIGKNVWHGHKPEGSPEAAHHAANFKEWYKTIG